MRTVTVCSTLVGDFIWMRIPDYTGTPHILPQHSRFFPSSFALRFPGVDIDLLYWIR